jgi:16S rRNA (guanine527-N7)-methyltransferase
MTALQTGLDFLGLEFSGEKREKLEGFIREIELWNPRYGLLAPDEDIVGRHVIDSLSGVGPIRNLEPGTLADVGSGAGFPGIPLAVWLDDVQVTLIERSGRRAGFLRNAVVVLGLENVRVLEMPVEEVPRRSGTGGFDVITFRAWSPVDNRLLDSLEPLLVPGGRIAAYKGRRDVIQSELDSVSDRIASADIRGVKSLTGEERHLVLLRIRD